jgi:peroxiredoxin
MLQIIFGMVLPWLLVGIGCWLFYHLIRQNGRILLHLEALDARLAQLGGAGSAPTGLPVGEAAPDFDLPDLTGARHTLAEFKGRKVLLIFFSPQCGYCLQMAPALAALETDSNPLPLVITSGDAEANRQLVKEHGIKCLVLLQAKDDLAAWYKAAGTPTGYLIDEEGLIASPLTVGADALLALGEEPEEAAGNGQARPRGKVNRGLAASKIKRDGLPPGTPAPGFSLPRLDGGELALEDYRGQRVLLVFSDPGCGPCDQLVPQLEEHKRRHLDIQVVMISRRDPESNRRKVAQHGLTFPVVLQKAWEISKLYAMFAMPVGYLIDEQGIIASKVALGGEPILALLSATPAQVS